MGLGILGYLHRYDPAMQYSKESLAVSAVINESNKAKEKGQIDRAIELLTQAISDHPQIPDAHYQRAVDYFDKSELAKAVADCSEAIRLCDQHPQSSPQFIRRWAIVLRLRCNHELREHAMEIRDYSELIGTDTNPTLLIGRAMAYKANHQFSEAIDDFKKAFEHNPTLEPKYRSDLVNTYLASAQAHQDKGDITKAAADLDMAAKLDPESRNRSSSNGKANVVIKLPEGAKVLVQNQPMSVTGSECRFQSADRLDSSIPVYFYDVTAVLTVNGMKHAESRKIYIFPNETTESDFTDLLTPNKKLRTYEYWCALVKVEKAYSAFITDARGNDYVKALRQLASIFENASTRGVDEEAVGAFLESGECLSKLATFIERNNGIDAPLEAFIRGMLGDPLGVINEYNADQRAVKETIDRAHAKMTRMRAILTARYDIEFPPF